MTTLYIRHPSKASVDASPAGLAVNCHFALAGEAGAVLQQGVAALGSLTDLVAQARRVVLILAASDVTLLQVKVPPLSKERLKAALPGLVEDHLLGDPADCVLIAAPQQEEDGSRTVAVVQRNWLEALAKALLAQGARSIAALPAQLCLPFHSGAVTAALVADDSGVELTLRQAQYAGMGLAMALDPGAALATLRALAGAAPATLYLAPSMLADYQALADGHEPPIALAPHQWEHWVAAAQGARLDLIPGLGAAGTQARNWKRWRWPLGLAALALLVNIVGLNYQWWRMRREADTVRLTLLQTFKAAYPKETVILDPLAQMRSKIAAAKADGGQVGADEFTGLASAFGAALRSVGKIDLAGLEYREHALIVKPKPGGVDPALMPRLKAALAAHQLSLTEPSAGNWQIRPINSAGAKP